MADNLFIGDLDPKAAVRLVESTSDLVVLLDADGRVLEAAVHDGSLAGLTPSRSGVQLDSYEPNLVAASAQPGASPAAPAAPPAPPRRGARPPERR